MKEISSEIDIKAPTDKVWKILIDFQRYSEWNPFIRSVQGEPVVGRKIGINLRAPSGKERNYEPTITLVNQARELRWIGRSFFLNAEHIFSLETTTLGLTRFVQREVFKGLLSRFFGEDTDRDITAGFDRMNQALKQRAELA